MFIFLNKYMYVGVFENLAKIIWLSVVGKTVRNIYYRLCTRLADSVQSFLENEESTPCNFILVKKVQI